jgi:hypothetical protein
MPFDDAVSVRLAGNATEAPHFRRYHSLRKRQRFARLAALYCANPTWIVTVAYTVTVPV